MLIRLFGVFAILFGGAYLAEGVPWLYKFVFGQQSREQFLIEYQMAVIFFDISIGMAALVIGIGLVLKKDWAREGWLGLLLFTLFGHLVVSAMAWIGFGVSPFNYWQGMVVVLTIISWAYLTKESVKSGFKKQTPDIPAPPPPTFSQN
jgi:hypothetical protein